MADPFSNWGSGGSSGGGGGPFSGWGGGGGSTGGTYTPTHVSGGGGGSSFLGGLFGGVVHAVESSPVGQFVGFEHYVAQNLWRSPSKTGVGITQLPHALYAGPWAITRLAAHDVTTPSVWFEDPRRYLRDPHTLGGGLLTPLVKQYNTKYQVSNIIRDAAFQNWGSLGHDIRVAGHHEAQDPLGTALDISVFGKAAGIAHLSAIERAAEAGKAPGTFGRLALQPRAVFYKPYPDSPGVAIPLNYQASTSFGRVAQHLLDERRFGKIDPITGVTKGGIPGHVEIMGHSLGTIPFSRGSALNKLSRTSRNIATAQYTRLEDAVRETYKGLPDNQTRAIAQVIAEAPRLKSVTEDPIQYLIDIRKGQIEDHQRIQRAAKAEGTPVPNEHDVHIVKSLQTEVAGLEALDKKAIYEHNPRLKAAVEAIRGRGDEVTAEAIRRGRLSPTQVEQRVYLPQKLMSGGRFQEKTKVGGEVVPDEVKIAEQARAREAMKSALAERTKVRSQLRSSWNSVMTRFGGKTLREVFEEYQARNRNLGQKSKTFKQFAEEVYNGPRRQNATHNILFKHETLLGEERRANDAYIAARDRWHERRPAMTASGKGRQHHTTRTETRVVGAGIKGGTSYKDLAAGDRAAIESYVRDHELPATASAAELEQHVKDLVAPYLEDGWRRQRANGPIEDVESRAGVHWVSKQIYIPDVIDPLLTDPAVAGSARQRYLIAMHEIGHLAQGGPRVHLDPATSGFLAHWHERLDAEAKAWLKGFDDLGTHLTPADVEQAHEYFKSYLAKARLDALVKHGAEVANELEAGMPDSVKVLLGQKPGLPLTDIYNPLAQYGPNFRRPHVLSTNNPEGVSVYLRAKAVLTRQGSLDQWKRNKGVLWLRGQIANNPELFHIDNLRQARWFATEDHFDDWVVPQSGAPDPALYTTMGKHPDEYFIKTKRGGQVPRDVQNAGEFFRGMTQEVDDALEREQQAYVTKDLEAALKPTEGETAGAWVARMNEAGIRRIPSQIAKDWMIDTRPSSLTRRIILRNGVNQLWRFFLLGIKPAWSVANALTNETLVAFRYLFTRGGGTAFYNSMVDTFGAARAAEIVKSRLLHNSNGVGLINLRNMMQADPRLADLFAGSFGHQLEAQLQHAGSMTEKWNRSIASRTARLLLPYTKDWGPVRLLRGFAAANYRFNIHAENAARAASLQAEIVRVTGKMVKTTEDLQQFMKHGTPEQFDKVRSGMLDTMGDYGNLGSFEREWIVTFAPFYPWFKTIMGITAKWVTRHPERLWGLGVMAHAFQQAQNQDYQLGVPLPYFAADSIPAGKPQAGEQRILTDRAFNPLVTPIDILNTARALTGDPNAQPSDLGLALLGPAASFGYVAITGRDPFYGGEYQGPLSGTPAPIRGLGSLLQTPQYRTIQQFGGIPGLVPAYKSKVYNTPKGPSPIPGISEADWVAIEQYWGVPVRYANLENLKGRALEEQGKGTQGQHFYQPPTSSTNSGSDPFSSWGGG